MSSIALIDNSQRFTYGINNSEQQENLVLNNENDRLNKVCVVNYFHKLDTYDYVQFPDSQINTYSQDSILFLGYMIGKCLILGDYRFTKILGVDTYIRNFSVGKDPWMSTSLSEFIDLGRKSSHLNYISLLIYLFRDLDSGKCFIDGKTELKLDDLFSTMLLGFVIAVSTKFSLYGVNVKTKDHTLSSIAEAFSFVSSEV